MVQEGTHNLNVTLKGYQKKFWGFWSESSQNTITLFHPQKEVYP